MIYYIMGVEIEISKDCN